MRFYEENHVLWGPTPDRLRSRLGDRRSGPPPCGGRNDPRGLRGLPGRTGEGVNLALKDQKGMSNIFNELSTGIGIRISRMKLDYMVGQDSSEFGLNHRLSLTFELGRKVQR